MSRLLSSLILLARSNRINFFYQSCKRRCIAMAAMQEHGLTDSKVLFPRCSRAYSIGLWDGSMSTGRARTCPLLTRAFAAAAHPPCGHEDSMHAQPRAPELFACLLYFQLVWRYVMMDGLYIRACRCQVHTYYYSNGRGKQAEGTFSLDFSRAPSDSNSL